MFIRKKYSMIIDHILSFAKRYKKILFLIILVLGIFFIMNTFALEPDATSPWGSAAPIWWGTTNPVVSKEVSEKVVNILNGIITGASAIMGLLTSFITIFLYPGWVNGTLFGLQDYLKEIWILISNVVYFIFAFILIAIAFMNIIGKGEGNWELKQAMPKFIVGVLIVPFSWFFVQFMLSLSAILTVGVLTLPYDSFNSETLFQKWIQALEKEKICKDVIINFSDEDLWATTPIASGAWGDAVSERIVCAEDGTVSVKELFEGTGDGAGLQNSVFGIINLYTYGILKIQELDTITWTNLESITKIADLIFKILFDLLFIIVYALLMVALFLALFVRGVRLWIYIMLSPTFGLLYFFWKVSEWVGDSDNKFSIKEFIALAMVPVYVAAALAFGLVFILVASEWIKETTTQGEEDTLKAGGFSLTIKWAHGDGASEKSVIWKLIVEIFGVVILWIAVMAALKSSATTRTVVEPIAAFGKSVGDLAAKAPTYAPIIPTRSGGWQSAASLKTIGGNITAAAQSKQTDRAKEFMDNYGWWWDSAKMSAAADKIANNIENGVVSRAWTMAELRKLFKQGIKVDGMIWNSNAHRAVKAAAKAIGMTPEEINAFDLSTRQWFADAIAKIDYAAKKSWYWDLIESHDNWWSNSFKYTDLDAYIEGAQSVSTPSSNPWAGGTVNISFDKSWLIDSHWKIEWDRDAWVTAVAQQIIARNVEGIMSKEDFRSSIDDYIFGDSDAVELIIQEIERRKDTFFKN